jgi:hypothetical protein
MTTAAAPSGTGRAVSLASGVVVARMAPTGQVLAATPSKK